MSNEETRTDLRQGDLKIHVVGKVAEIALEEAPNKTGVNAITGYVSVKVSEKNQVRIRVNVPSQKNDGTPNDKVFPGIQTVMNEYKSIAKYGEEEADVIAVNGTLNPYRSNNTGQDVMSYQSNFFSRVRSTDWEPEATFDAEVYLSSMTPEMDKDGDETGRLIVKGIGVTFNGAEPIKFVVPKETANMFEDNYEIGQTVELWGDLVNERIEVIKETPVRFGVPKKDVSTTYRNELIIMGASEPYEEGVTEKAPYAKSAIDMALQERENRIAEAGSKQLAANNPYNNKNTAPSGAAKGRTLNF